MSDEASMSEIDRLRSEVGDWQHRCFLVANAVAKESDSAEQLANIARKTRAELAAANEEIARLAELSARLKAARDELEAVYEAAKVYQCEWCKRSEPRTDCHSQLPTTYHGYAYRQCATPLLSDALAAVDARRGAGR